MDAKGLIVTVAPYWFDAEFGSTLRPVVRGDGRIVFVKTYADGIAVVLLPGRELLSDFLPDETAAIEAAKEYLRTH